MTIEEKRQKIEEHCNSMKSCSDCELRSAELNCWIITTFLSDEDVEVLYKILNYGKADFNWIPCEESLPEGNDNEIPCLVTCSEWDIFDGCWGKKELRIISFITSTKTWNTKSAVRIDAWMYLPDPYGSDD